MFYSQAILSKASVHTGNTTTIASKTEMILDLSGEDVEEVKVEVEVVCR